MVAPAEDDHVTKGRDGGNGDGGDGDGYDDDDYWMCDDDAFDDEDGGGLSREEARRSSWLRGFVAWMGKMSTEEVAVMLCPACKGGPGGSQRYRGFHALLDHARRVMAKRVRLHRRFAEILEEELRTRRPGRQGDGSEQTTATDEKCEGLGGGAEGVAGDRRVPWPPMVVVLNTRLGKQEGSDKVVYRYVSSGFPFAPHLQFKFLLSQRALPCA